MINVTIPIWKDGVVLEKTKLAVNFNCVGPIVGVCYAFQYGSNFLEVKLVSD